MVPVEICNHRIASHKISQHKLNDKQRKLCQKLEFGFKSLTNYYNKACLEEITKDINLKHALKKLLKTLTYIRASQTYRNTFYLLTKYQTQVDRNSKQHFRPKRCQPSGLIEWCVIKNMHLQLQNVLLGQVRLDSCRWKTGKEHNPYHCCLYSYFDQICP